MKTLNKFCLDLCLQWIGCSATFWLMSIVIMLIDLFLVDRRFHTEVLLYLRLYHVYFFRYIVLI